MGCLCWTVTLFEFGLTVISCSLVGCYRLAGRQVISLIALALNLDEHYFEKIGALDNPAAFLRLLHYPGSVTHVTFNVKTKEKKKVIC